MTNNCNFNLFKNILKLFVYQLGWLTKWLEYDYALIMRDVAWIDENLPAEIGKVSVSGCFNQFSKNGCGHEDKIFADPATIGCVITYFNMKEQQVAAGMNILKLCLLWQPLVYGVGISTDAELLVIGPIERMLDTVQLLAENPLANTDAGFNPLMDEEEQQKKQGTALLEKTLKRLVV